MAEVLADYTTAAAAGHAPQPTPTYLGNAVKEQSCANSGLPVTDINYELLQLFVQYGVGREQMGPPALGLLLRPAGHSPEPLEHLLSWHLLTLLVAVGVLTTTSPAAAAKVRHGLDVSSSSSRHGLPVLGCPYEVTHPSFGSLCWAGGQNDQHSSCLQCGAL